MVTGHERAWKWGAALGLVMAMAAPGVGQDAAIDFGDDSSRWANNGVCDDPRFSGEGAARLRLSGDLGRDATDCAAALEAGTVTYVGAADSEPDPVPEPEAESPPPLPADPQADSPAVDDPDAAEIDFGDDSSPWANDGECDDPRFEGEGAALNTTASDLGRDATDCQAAFEAGTVTYLGETAPEGEVPPALPDTPPPLPADPDAAEIDFGDDSGGWPNDGECDDPRFEGEAVASYLDPANVRGDASDCRAAFEAGTATYIGEDHLTLPTTDRIVEDGIDFGLDTSTWANDGECDDPRFEGEGAASMRYDYNIQADASDCVAAYRDGTVTYLGEPDEDAAEPAEPDETEAQSRIVDGIDFGDDTGQWANDGECDDPRFEGEAMAFSPSEDHRGRDAADCIAAYGEGTIRLIVPLAEREPANLDKIVHGRTPETAGIHFGSDTSRWAHDGECDDPRFEGEGAAKTRLEQDMFADATDCRNAVEAGTVVFTP